MNTVLFVNATIGFSANLFLVLMYKDLFNDLWTRELNVVNASRFLKTRSCLLCEKGFRLCQI